MVPVRDTSLSSLEKFFGNKSLPVLRWALGEDTEVKSRFSSSNKESFTLNTRFGLVYVGVDLGEGKAYLHKLSQAYYNVLSIDLESGEMAVSLSNHALEKLKSEGFTEVDASSVFSNEDNPVLARVRLILNRANFRPVDKRGYPVVVLNRDVFIHRPIAKLLGENRIPVNRLYYSHTPAGLSVLLGASYPRSSVVAMLWEFFLKSKELAGGPAMAKQRMLESRESPVERALINLEIAELLSGLE